MKKLFCLIVILLFAAFIWFGSNAATADYQVVTSKISESNTVEKYSIDIEYPKIVSSSSAYQFINADISEIIATTTTAFDQSAKEFARYIKDNNLEAEGLTQGSSLTIRYEVASGTENSLPVKILIEEYDAGAAHPSHIMVTRNYDVQRQKILNLSDLFSEPKYLQQISAYAKPALIQKFDSENAPADAEWITTGTEPKAENYEAWLAQSDGLRIIFNEYQVAPYAYGIPEILIPWSALPNLKK